MKLSTRVAGISNPMATTNDAILEATMSTINQISRRYPRKTVDSPERSCLQEQNCVRGNILV